MPAPFGTVLSSEKSLRQMLSEQSDMWLSKLAQGEGCVEVSIKAFVKHDALLRAVMIDVDTRPLFLSGPLATEPRVTELEAQRDAHNRLSKVLGGLHRTCASLSREAVLKPMPLRDSGELGKLELRAVYLVKRSKFADIDAAVDAVNDTHGDWLTVIINGPHAPFNHLQRVDAFEM